MHFATGVRRSGVVRLSWLSRHFTRAKAAKMLASSSSRILLFLFETLLYIHTHKYKSNGVRFGHSKASISVTMQTLTHIHMGSFFSQWHNIMSRNNDFPRKIPCILWRKHSTLDVYVYKLLLYFHFRPANQPTITGMALWHKYLNARGINVPDLTISLCSSTAHCMLCFIQTVP